MSEFILGGRRSGDFGIIMTAPPKMVFAEPDVDTISIAGRSGDLILDNGRYKNVSVPYNCAILPENGQSMRSAAERAVTILKPSAQYMRLENTYHPGTFRLARVSREVSIESIVEEAGIFTVEFDCKPQRFFTEGEAPIIFNAPGELVNQWFPALPIITVHGAGDCTVTVGDCTVTLFDMTHPITLDCDMQDAYWDDDGQIVNANQQISAPAFPVLQPGANAIIWTGSVARVEIIPRWWTL